MHTAIVLYFHFVLFYPDVVVTIVYMYASIFGSQPHRWLVNVFFRCNIINTRNVAAQSQATRICTWNVVRVRVVGARATAKQLS